MKKLTVLAGVLCFVFVSCVNKSNEPAQEEVTQQGEPKKECCKKSEEQKAECEAFCKQWEDWANLTDDVKKELIAKTKACFDKKDAEKEARATEMAECKAKWATFDQLTLDEQKALIDKRMQCEKQCKGDKKCCKEGEKKCCKADEKDCAKKCETKKEEGK